MSESLREATLPELRAILSRELSTETVRVERGHEGAVFLRILSERFEDADDPHDLVVDALLKHGLMLPARTICTLRAPSELEEGEESLLFGAAPHFRGTPNWADSLLFEPEGMAKDDREFRARVIAFWGVKGGVGRTTALAHVASTLGRSHKVLALDLDLDSPGLVATLAREPNGERPRFETLVRLAGDSNVSHAELKRQIQLALRPAKGTKNAHVLGPARADTEFVKDLLGPLAPSALYRGQKQALRKLVRAAILAMDAEIVLVDVRSGYCDESAMVVLDLADEVVMFVSPAPSTFGSLGPAIEAMERNRQALGRPKIVHLVAGMLPSGEDTRNKVVEQLEGAIDDERRRVARVLATPSTELPPNIDVIPVFYTGRVVENEGRILEDTSAMYAEIAMRVAPYDRQATAFMAKLLGFAEPFPDSDASWTVNETLHYLANLNIPPNIDVPETQDLDALDIASGIALLTSQKKPSADDVANVNWAHLVMAGGSARRLSERFHKYGALIWGERMDELEGKQSTSRWISSRLRDGNAIVFPSVMMAFAKNTATMRLSSGEPSASLFDPASMRAALPHVAAFRLQHVTEHADDATKRAIAALRGQDADQPRERLTEHLKSATGDGNAFALLQRLGVLRVTRRYDGTEMVRIVDLYALAPELQVRRTGRR